MRNDIECESKLVTENCLWKIPYFQCESIVTFWEGDCRECLDWMFGFIVLIHSRVVTTMIPLLISTIHSSPQHPLSFFQPAVFSPAVPWQRHLIVEILQLPALRSFFRRLSFRTACQLFPELNYIAISSQPSLQNKTALRNFFHDSTAKKPKSKLCDDRRSVGQSVLE
jgi:hypothetical protein